MRFAHPSVLFALVLVPIALVLLRIWWQRSMLRLASLSRHAGKITTSVKVQSLLLLAAFAMSIIALSGPAWGKGQEEKIIRSRNVMLAVDVSRSMLATDVRPNRLERAKADLIDLVNDLKGDRAGLLAFRGKGVLLCPMTTDVAFLRQSIDALAPDSAPTGETDLADAIEKCLAAFDQAQSSHNAIVLISDGEDLAGRAKTLAERAAQRKVPIFTVGIGSAQGATIPDGAGVLMHEGKEVKSQLTESTLKAIAEISGGRYVPLATAGTAQTTLGAVYTRYLTRLADEEAREQEEALFVNRTALFATLSALLCLIAGLLSVGRLGSTKRLALFIICCTTTLFAQEPARKAQQLYREAQYAAAAEAYALARQGAEPSQEAHYAYNEALALWREGDITNALQRVQMAVTAKPFTARAATLEGLLQLQLAEETEHPVTRLALKEAAIESLAKALREDPSDTAQRNLSRALEGLEALRQEARKTAAIERYQKTQFPQLVTEILQHQRGLMKAAPEVFTTVTPSLRLSQFEQLAKDVTEQSDRWYPILETLPTVVTNETLQVELLQHARGAQETLDAAAEDYADLKASATTLNDVEPIAYNFWKLVAQPDALITEAIAVQTNALTTLTRYQPARDDEEEVLNLVQHFRVIFPQWAENFLQQQAASTNEVSFTEADRDLIARTADATVPLLAPPVSQENKQQVMDNLNKIRDLLPKSNQSQNQQDQQNNQQDQQDQQQNQDQQNQSQENENQQSQEQAEQQEQKESQEELKKEDLEALLQKAINREREHENEKRKRALQHVRPNERDW